MLDRRNGQNPCLAFFRLIPLLFTGYALGVGAAKRPEEGELRCENSLGKPVDLDRWCPPKYQEILAWGEEGADSHLEGIPTLSCKMGTAFVVFACIKEDVGDVVDLDQIEPYLPPNSKLALQKLDELEAFFRKLDELRKRRGGVSPEL